MNRLTFAMTEEQRDRFAQAVDEASYYWDDPNGPEYMICPFCKFHSPRGYVEHHNDCVGQELFRFLLDPM